MGRVYLYGVTEGSEAPAIAPAGPRGAGQVYSIWHDGIAAVVSDYTGQELGVLPREELVQSLLVHQRVIEQVMPGGTVLPAKVGTVLASAEEARALLSQGRLDLVKALEANRGRFEIEVAAAWDTGRVLQEIGAEGDVVQARKAITAKGQPSVEERARLGRMVKCHMDRRRESYRERILGLLAPLSVDVALNALVSDELVVNVAFLVNQDQRQEFEDGVERLDQLFQGEINFRIIGPLPPYSFSTVEVTTLSSAKVEAAAQTLRLGEMFSEGEVRRAYRRLAAQAQREVSLGNEAAWTRFFEARRASDLLLSYLMSTQQHPGHQHPGPGGAPLFLIKIRRSAVEELPHAPSPGPVEAGT